MLAKFLQRTQPHLKVTGVLSLSSAPILWPLVAYFLLTILMTWPAILHGTDGIPGDGFDGWQNYWNLWWVKEALLVLGVNPFFTDYLYPPTGASLLFHTLNIFNVWTLPLQLNFGLAVAYNSVVLFSFVLAGYGGYLLALYTLTRLKFPTTPGLRLAAFVGGLVFTMSPFHMAHLLGHMQVFSMVWPPFYALWLIRTLEPWPSDPPDQNRSQEIDGSGETLTVSLARFLPKSQIRNIALTSLFLILATLVDWYHTLYLLIFTGLTLLWSMWRRWQILTEQKHRSLPESKIIDASSPRRRPPPPHQRQSQSTYHLLHIILSPLRLVFAIGLSFILILSPLLIPMLGAAGSRPDLQTGLAQNIILSADLLAFVTPSGFHPIWGEWARSIMANFQATFSEQLVFAGFVPLALSLWVMIRAGRNPVVRLWSLVALLFFLLALGPYLHIGGKMVALAGWPIPMPYLLLYHTVPFIGLTRSLSRYDLMLMLSLGVLVALALAHLQSPTSQTPNPLRPSRPTPHALRPTPYALRTLPFLAALLICFEFLPIPYPVSQIDIPAFYFELGAQADDFTIAELPMNWDRPAAMLHQTIHRKRLLTAYTSRDNPLELAWRTPVFQHWRYLGPDIIDQPLPVIAPTIFFDFNLRYIVLDYWQMPPGPEREATERWVRAALPQARPVYEDGRLKVYQAPPKQETQPYLSLGAGWGRRYEDQAGLLSRPLALTPESPPELFVHHPQNQALTLEITLTGSNQTLTVSVEGEPLQTFDLTPNFATHSLSLPPSSAPWLKLTFHSDKPAGPVAVSRISLHMNQAANKRGRE